VKLEALKKWLIRSDPLTLGLLASVLLHMVIMTVQFRAPDALQFKAADPQLDIVLLNAGTRTKPLKADVLAQVSSEGGGDRDKGRAKSPLPADTKVSDGDELVIRRTQVQQLEAQQRQLLALANKPNVNLTDRKQVTEQAIEKGLDPADSQAVISRMQAEIAKQIDDYNKRPKRLTFGVNALGVSFAEYVDAWTEKVEELGTGRYPAAARGKLYDSLILTVELDKFGNVHKVIFNQRSKHDILNKAAREIVYAGAPYARFTKDMAEQADILQIVRTWYFTKDGLAVDAASPAQ
jgi:periplasmic protein TonB